MQWITGTYLPTTRAFRIPVPTVSHSIGVSQPPPAGDASLGVKQHSSWFQRLLQNQERKPDASDNPIWFLLFVFKEMNQEMQRIKNEWVKELKNGQGWCEKPSELFSSEIPPEFISAVQPMEVLAQTPHFNYPRQNWKALYGQREPSGPLAPIQGIKEGSVAVIKARRRGSISYLPEHL